MRAIRIDGKEVIRASAEFRFHSDLFLEYMRREGLTDKKADEMLDADRVEFGFVYLDSKTNELVFASGLPSKQYLSVLAVRSE